jgi:2-hydroxychromene-2-carboxylate isomerase
VSGLTLYLDLGSPYAYLAAERAYRLFRDPVEFQPVLLGANLPAAGWGSWAETERREAGMSEVEERARCYDLPPVVWPAAFLRR